MKTKTVPINFRLSPEDAKRLRDQAKRCGRTISGHLMVLVKAGEIMEARAAGLDIDSLADSVSSLVREEVLNRLSPLSRKKS
jgi:predicted DNA-binding protein